VDPEHGEAEGPAQAAKDRNDWTVLHTRSVSDLDQLQSNLFDADGRAADLFLRFVRDTALLGHDRQKLLTVISDYTFLTFPQASYFVLVVAQPVSGELMPLVARNRAGDQPAVILSQTLIGRVMDEGLSLLFSAGQGESQASESIRLSRIRTAICAPLISRDETFGVLQLDIRHPDKGAFGRKDVDRLALFANYVALVLDNLRLYHDQEDAFASTIRALVHSLSLKDPDTALHSERVQLVAEHIGRAMKLSGAEFEVLSVAALLHDMGKQGIRNEVLLKPARLSDEERAEMSRHTELTQGVLDRVRFPVHLKNVPLIAAYHHEKMDGSGPYRLKGEAIPIQSRIISVADVFDALVSARAYKTPLALPKVLSILDAGQGKEWDPVVVQALKGELFKIVRAVYNRTPEEMNATGSSEDIREAA
jgi:HD-GYP domain-containing protein (c-di-GMP phosphodiesterase class II)